MSEKQDFFPKPYAETGNKDLEPVEKPKDITAEYQEKLGETFSQLQYHYYELSSEERNEHYETLLENEELIKKAFREGRYSGHGILCNLNGIMKLLDYDDESENPQEKFKSLACKIVFELREDIMKAIKKNRLHWYEGIQILLRLINEDTGENRMASIDTLADNTDVIENGFGDKERLWLSVGCLNSMLALGSDQQVKNAIEILHRVTYKYVEDRRFVRLFPLFFSKNKNPEVEKDLENWGTCMIYVALRRMRLPIVAFMKAWEISGKPEKFFENIGQNLAVMLELNENNKDICQSLYKEFGIMDFGRYPASLLLQQYKDKDDLSRPYGVIMYPRNDWNGAFYQNQNVFKKLFQETQGELNLRITECESKIDIARALIKLDKKYNTEDKEGHKISLLILGGHGEKNIIQFGGNDAKHRLTIEDLAGKGVQRTSQFFEENPTIILASCSTGAEKGIGQGLSRMLGAKVVAPKVPTRLESLHASKKPGVKFRFNARFAEKEELKSVFFQGQKV